MIMGIVNVTPDSFSDGGAFSDPENAIRHALQLAEDGADIIDIGGESTRPPGNDYAEGSTPVGADEELRRIIPVIEALHSAHPEIVISVDTMKPEVAQRALRSGATMMNDVSAGRYDESIWKIAAAENVPYILMHGYDPGNRIPIDQITYSDVVGEVFSFLEERITAARRAGVSTVIADVGIGFAKGARENIRLIREHSRFTELGVTLLLGASRKSFIGRILGGRPVGERLAGTLAAHAVGVMNGARIVRVHDVRAARDFFTVFDALYAGEGALTEIYES
jgi:dihydropteroate synthase